MEENEQNLLIRRSFQTVELTNNTTTREHNPQQQTFSYPQPAPQDLIAPLMGISIRGVENHRYRLRKKMNLEHDDSLTDLILKI